MVIRHEHHSTAALGRGKDPLDAARREGQGPLAEDMHLGRERAENVGLVQVIGRGDDDGVELIELEKILDVGERVGDAEAVGERSRFRTIVVADRRQFGPAHLRQNRQMRELRDRPRADDADADTFLHWFGLRGGPNT